MKEKIALFCDVDVEAVITARDVGSVYEVPLVFAEQGVDEIVLRPAADSTPAPRDLRPLDARWCERLQEPDATRSTSAWSASTSSTRIPTRASRRRCCTAAWPTTSKRQHRLDRGGGPRLARLRSRSCEDYDGILVPGGFGKRGIEGMINAIRYARERKVPYFGICLGMQTMVIEFARNVCGLEDAEFHRVRPGHAAPRDLQTARAEGRRRTGRHHAAGRLPLPPGRRQLRPRRPTAMPEISERHRHRYEFNREYEERADRPRPARSPAKRPTAMYVEICEIADHPWFLGCQFHPEFKSKPLEPHPLFSAFIGAAIEYRGKAPEPLEPPRSRCRTSDGRRVRCRQAAGPDRRAVRHRERGARPFPGRAKSATSPGDFVFKASFDKANRVERRLLSRPGPAGRACASSPRCKPRRLPDPDRHPRACAGRGRRPRSPTFSRFRRSSAARPICCWRPGGPGRMVNIKKGQFVAPHDIRQAAEKVASTGNDRIILTERGSTFRLQQPGGGHARPGHHAESAGRWCSTPPTACSCRGRQAPPPEGSPSSSSRWRGRRSRPARRRHVRRGARQAREGALRRRQRPAPRPPGRLPRTPAVD